MFNGDTVLYLTKPQAVDIANFKLKCDQLQSRFDFAIKREKALQSLYEEMRDKSAIQDSTINLLNARDRQRIIQMELIQNQVKKEKRTATIRSGIVSLCLGLIIGVAITK